MTLSWSPLFILRPVKSQMEHRRLNSRVCSELCPFNAGKWALHLGHLFGVPSVLVSLPLPLFTHKQTGTKTGVALVNTLFSHRLTGAWERKKDTPTLSILLGCFSLFVGIRVVQKSELRNWLPFSPWEWILIELATLTGSWTGIKGRGISWFESHDLGFYWSNLCFC